MQWILFMGVFCISLSFFLYAKKSKRQALPADSYIIFKDYSADYSKPVTVSDVKADRIVPGTVIATLEDKTDSSSEKQEEPILPTLNFED